MKTNALYWLCLWAVLLNSLALQAQTTKPVLSTMIEDPVFGVSFDPFKVKFENIPSKLKQLCHLSDEGHLWLFSHLKTDRSDYYIVMGWSYDQEGDSFGNAVWTMGNSCSIAETGWVLSGIPSPSGYSSTNVHEKLPGLGVPAPKSCQSDPQAVCNYQLRSAHEEFIIRGLVRDAIQRASKAYGGEAQFKKKACSPYTIKANSYSPIVQQELRQFCSQAN